VIAVASGVSRSTLATVKGWKVARRVVVPAVGLSSPVI
jgi:hypothetical protein